MKYFENNSGIWLGAYQQPSAWEERFQHRNAPFFLRKFTLTKTKGVTCAICAAGVYELYVNGKRVGDHQFDPIVSMYDKHARYVSYDISSYLKKGKNAVGVILGNGWFNNHSDYGDVWNFSNASWRAIPRFCFEMKDAAGCNILTSDLQWKCFLGGPILFNSFRAGEQYDASKELGDWCQADFDDSKWDAAVPLKGPGGEIEEQYAPAIKILEVFSMKRMDFPMDVYDAGENIAGRVRITVKGEKGQMVQIDYAERLDGDGYPDQSQINQLCRNGRFQFDQYTLKGDGTEVWESRFGYNGFRYACIRDYDKSKLKILKVEAVVLGSSFDCIGSFECSNKMLNQLQKITHRSYISNFVGIPTDCPHREKNGWTGDAQIASETGLYNYDGAEAYRQWMSTIRDYQRPSGDIPGFVPHAGNCGYNWGNGPGWDCVLFVIPWNVYRYTGNDTMLRENYDAMLRWLNMIPSTAINNIVQFGLGDWCCPDQRKMVDYRLTVTACYYDCLKIMVKTAKLFGDKETAKKFEQKMKEVKEDFNREFYKGNGMYCKGEISAFATPLYHDLCPAGEKAKVVRQLVKAVEKCGCKAEFGLFGTKYVARVLADNGYTDLAVRMLTQEEFPGWGYMVKRGATTLWECWDGHNSQDHVMFGDLSAWMYQYLAGFRHDEKTPGYKHLILQPFMAKEVTSVNASYRGYASQWSVKNGKFSWTITIPDGCTATVILPDGTKSEEKAGTFRKTCKCLF